MAIYKPRIDKIITTLSEIGLNGSEATVYTTLLFKGAQSVLNLAKTTGIKRTTIYSILDRLLEQGLVHTQARTTKKRFFVESPERLESVLELKRKKLAGILPELNAHFLGLSEKDNYVRHYKGVAGIKTVYEKLLIELKRGDFYLVVTDQEQWLKIDPEYFKNYIPRRAKIGLETRILRQLSLSDKIQKGEEARFQHQVRFLPENSLINTNMLIVPRKVIIIQIIEPVMAMVIENPSVIEMNKVLFEIAWINAMQFSSL